MNLPSLSTCSENGQSRLQSFQSSLTPMAENRGMNQARSNLYSTSINNTNNPTNGSFVKVYRQRNNNHLQSQMRSNHNSIINNRLQLSNVKNLHGMNHNLSVASKIKCFHCDQEFPSRRFLPMHCKQSHPGLPMVINQLSTHANGHVKSDLDKTTPSPSHLDREGHVILYLQYALNMVMKQEPSA